MVTLDSEGCLTLPPEIRDEYGDRYHVVRRHNSITLISIAADPLEALRDDFSAIEKPADELLAGTRDAGGTRTEKSSKYDVDSMY